MTTTQTIKKSERYVRGLRSWLTFIRKEPNGLLAGSCWFLLTCLPLVTIGPAWLALNHYMDHRNRGIKTSWREAMAFSLRTAGAKGWLMGLSDLAAAVMAGGCILALLEGSLPLPLGFLYALLFLADLLYLLGGLYRWPALAREPGNKLTLLIARGFLMAVGNPGWSLMFAFAGLLAFLICLLTGVGIILLFPAASALLATCAYGSMVKIYLPPETDNEE